MSSLELESRTRLLDLPVGLVENLRTSISRPDRGLEGFCGAFQVCLPYRGLFVWHVGGEDVVGDANQVVFVKAGEPFAMSQPVRGGYAELIVTPALDVLSELLHADAATPACHPLFARRTRRAETGLQRSRARFLHWALTASPADDLDAEERLLALLRDALRQPARPTVRCGPASARLIRRTKTFLESNLSHRILLGDVARAAGASPAYLTDLFRRVEGASLHQYLTQLRLARALDELPHADDLTRLALEVGFSSHSHFTAAFRQAFGCTPSQFRRSTRRERLHDLVSNSRRRPFAATHELRRRPHVAT